MYTTSPSQRDQRQPPPAVFLSQRFGSTIHATLLNADNGVHTPTGWYDNVMRRRYTVEEDLLRQTRPTHVFTQALCAVCAPATGEVEAVCRRLGDVLGVGPSTAGGAGGASATKAPIVINLEPNNLEDVVTTFSVIAEHCGCPERVSMEQGC